MIDRRGFLAVAAGAALWPFSRVLAAHHEKPTPGGDLEAALAKSGFVYVSPLRSDGEESTCHGEVWFGHLDGAVVLITATSTWKARALERGLDRARIWVGDHGRWKRMLGSNNEAFREAPSFDAKAEVVVDDALLDRLLATYEEKYPEEIANWRDRMRSGYQDGSRVLIRYSPS
jgi:hypothetical protein